MTIDDAPRATTTLEGRVTGLINGRLDMVIDDADLDLFASGLLDSLAFVSLLHAFEEEFGVTIGVDDLEIDSFRSISSIVAFVSASQDGRYAQTVTHEAGRPETGDGV